MLILVRRIGLWRAGGSVDPWNNRFCLLGIALIRKTSKTTSLLCSNEEGGWGKDGGRMERVLDGRVEEINRAWPYYNWLSRVFITVTVIDLRFGPLPQEMEGGGGSSDSVIVPQNYEFRCVPCFSPS